MIPGVRSNDSGAVIRNKKNEKNTLVYEENIRYTYKPHTIELQAQDLGTVQVIFLQFLNDKILVSVYPGEYCQELSGIEKNFREWKFCNGFFFSIPYP